MLYFQNDLTREFEEKYGDLHTQILETEFVMLQLIEKEIMDVS